MKLRVSHLTRYQYDREVGFSPHRLYLRPRESPLHRLRSYALNVTPHAKLIALRDPEDNPLVQAYFWDRSDALSFRSDFEIETLDTNPFDFFLQPDWVRCPFSYEPALSAQLQPYLNPPAGPVRQQLADWLDRHLQNRSEETVTLLGQLNFLVYSTLIYERRETGVVQSSETTLQRQSGACRDFAALFVDLCRTLGLAARFVSGYLYAPAEDNHRTIGAMHAWAEVYLPGAGWKGLDPTHAIWCDDTFVPVAHAADASTVNPIQGSYFNTTPAFAQLHTDVRVERLA